MKYTNSPILFVHVNTEWKRFAREGRKVEAIKSLRNLYGGNVIGLKDAKDLVEEYAASTGLYDSGDTIALGPYGDQTIALNPNAKLDIQAMPSGKYRVTLVTSEDFAVHPADLLQMVADLSARVNSGGPRG